MRRIGIALFALLLGARIATPHGASAQSAQGRFPEGAEVVIAADAANARGAPGVDREITGVLYGGAALTIVGEPEYLDGYTWYEVQLRKPDVAAEFSGAWVAGEFLIYE